VEAVAFVEQPDAAVGRMLHQGLPALHNPASDAAGDISSPGDIDGAALYLF